eukprot:2835056-Karenia_brevis.AAC.1
MRESSAASTRGTVLDTPLSLRNGGQSVAIARGVDIAVTRCLVGRNCGVQTGTRAPTKCEQPGYAS